MKKKQTPPGRYGKMTRAQLDAESDKFDAEFSTDAAHAATPTELTAHPPQTRPTGQDAATESLARIADN